MNTQNMEENVLGTGNDGDSVYPVDEEQCG